MSTPQRGASSKALLVDCTRCIGCGACALACKQVNGLPRTADDPLDDELSSRTYTVVKNHGKSYARHLCMHCAEPTCASVCPVGAFRKSEAGPVEYLEERCIGCRYCMQACPFSVPRYEWEKVLPRVRKCIFCGDRLKNGLSTGCASACPTGATILGDRKALLAEARARIAGAPDRYIDHIYGETEVGGTSVLVLAGVPFADLGYPAGLPNHPMPQLTWNVMSQIPRFAFAAAVFLGGVYWITKRREDVHGHAGHGEEDR